MSQPTRTTKAWLYSESSTGRYLGSLRVSPVRRMEFWEATGVARKEFTDVIQPRLISYLRENSTEIPTSTCMLNLSLFMMGKSSLKTKPTVMFVSEDKNVRKEALNLAKNSGILLEYPGFALGACNLIAEFAGQRQIGDHSDKLTSSSGDTDGAVELFTDSASCLPGARICARSQGRPDTFSTIGGLFCHGGATLGLTVGHILHPESTAETMEPDYAENECEFIGLDESDEDNEDNAERYIEFVDSTSQASGSPVALPTSYNSDTASVSSFDFDDVDSSRGSWATGKNTTQSGLDQPLAPTVYHGTDFRNMVGHVIFASKPLDYCVFPMGLSRRSQPWQNTMFDLSDVDASLEYGPRETQISVFNERVGMITGAMKAFSSYCRFPSASDFQEVFTAQLNRPLVAGDCGSWVYDTQTNKLFGHVVAASVGNTVITIMPARDVFKDISTRLMLKTTQTPWQLGAMQPCSNETPMVPKSGSLTGDYQPADSKYREIYASWKAILAPDDERLNAWVQYRSQLSTLYGPSSLELNSVHTELNPPVMASASASAGNHPSTSTAQRRFSRTFDEPHHTTSSPFPPPSTAPSLASAFAEDPYDSQYVLPCEYARLGWCNETFQSGEYRVWEDHIADCHLQFLIPDRCICWFCNQEFSSEEHNIDASYNFSLRLEHIREHIIHDGCTVEHMRPDYFLLEHLYRNGLITEGMHRQERECEKGPDAAGIVSSETQREEELMSRVIHDNRKEEQLRRRERREQRQQRSGPCVQQRCAIRPTTIIAGQGYTAE